MVGSLTPGVDMTRVRAANNTETTQIDEQHPHHILVDEHIVSRYESFVKVIPFPPGGPDIVTVQEYVTGGGEATVMLFQGRPVHVRADDALGAHIVFMLHGILVPDFQPYSPFAVQWTPLHILCYMSGPALVQLKQLSGLNTSCPRILARFFETHCVDETTATEDVLLVMSVQDYLDILKMEDQRGAHILPRRIHPARSASPGSRMLSRMTSLRNI